MNIFGIFGVVFVVLKLTNYIDWSWWWVLAPFWGGFIWCVFWTFVFHGTTSWLDKNDPMWRWRK